MADDTAGERIQGVRGVEDVIVDASVRAAAIDVAARVLVSLPAARVPASLRAVVRFAPKRRASAGAGPLWATLQSDRGFRAEVAAVWAAAQAEVAHMEASRMEASQADSSQGDSSGADGASDAVDVTDREQALVERGVSLVLGRPEGWESDLADLNRELDAHREASRPVVIGQTEDSRLVREVERERAAHAEASAKVVELEQELSAARRDVRRLRSDADRAKAQAREAREIAAAEIDRVRALADAAQAEMDRARIAADRAEREIATERALSRKLREVLDARALLLLDTLSESASALRRELAIGATLLRPADLALPDDGAESGGRVGSRGRAGDDPAWLGELLAMPQAHLIVDGYNVTKTAHPEWTLAKQREWLTTALHRIAGRHGLEVTCVFDGVSQVGEAGGAGVRPGPVARGVRVRFSRDEIADDVVRRLVEAEPAGRVVIVVSTDQEVARDVRAMGAYAVDSMALVGYVARLG